MLHGFHCLTERIRGVASGSATLQNKRGGEPKDRNQSSSTTQQNKPGLNPPAASVCSAHTGSRSRAGKKQSLLIRTQERAMLVIKKRRYRDQRSKINKWTVQEKKHTDKPQLWQHEQTITTILRLGGVNGRRSAWLSWAAAAYWPAEADGRVWGGWGWWGGGCIILVLFFFPADWCVHCFSVVLGGGSVSVSKKREEGKVDGTTAIPNLPGPVPAPFPPPLLAKVSRLEIRREKHTTFVLIGSFGCLWDVAASLSHESHLSPAAGQQGLLSSGSARSATGSPCGAIPWSLLIGWSVGGPVRPQTASGGCKRCRRRRLRWCARAGWGWWCGWACCSWKALAERQTLASLLSRKCLMRFIRF